MLAGGADKREQEYISRLHILDGEATKVWTEIDGLCCK